MPQKRVSSDDVKSAVRRHYAQAVTTAGSCCGGSSCGTAEPGGSLAKLAGYTDGDLQALPTVSVESSLGCGNPLAFSEVKAGQTVLDIGSGAGIDCLLAAERVGPEGKVIGLDMTPEMLAKAEEAAARAGADNVEFRRGEAEQMPLEDVSVDWIVSNCVINLSPEKPRVFSEIARVLRSGGEIAISDIVLADDLPDSVVEDVRYWTGCVSGAIRESDYLAGLRRAGLEQVRVTNRFVYDAATIDSLISGCVDVPAEEATGLLAGKLASVLIRGKKN